MALSNMALKPRFPEPCPGHPSASTGPDACWGNKKTHTHTHKQINQHKNEHIQIRLASLPACFSRVNVDGTIPFLSKERGRMKPTSGMCAIVFTRLPFRVGAGIFTGSIQCFDPLPICVKLVVTSGIQRYIMFAPPPKSLWNRTASKLPTLRSAPRSKSRENWIRLSKGLLESRVLARQHQHLVLHIVGPLADWPKQSKSRQVVG